MSKPEKIMWPKGTTLESWQTLRHQVEGIGLSHTRIGASDVAATMGVSQWKCPARLYYHLLGIHNSFHITESTAAGHLLEPVVAARFMAFVPDDPAQSLTNWQYGVKTRKIKKAEFFVVHPDYPHLFVSLDYIPQGKVYSPFTGELYPPMTPIEIKSTTSGYRRNWGEEQIPVTYKIQLNTQMLLTGNHVGVFNVMVDGYKYEVREYYRDDLLCESIVRSSEYFGGLVGAAKGILEEIEKTDNDHRREELRAHLDSIAPEPTILEDDVDLSSEMAIDSDGSSRIATDQEEMLMLRYVGCNDSMTQLEGEKNKIRTTLVRGIGMEEVVASDAVKMTFKRGRNNKRDYFTIKLL